jgi:hypothetical protein
MAELPTFFFSHARQDRERSLNNYLEKFYQDLETRIADLEGIDLNETAIGTIDRETSQGEDWDRRLGTALKKNRAFVSIFTPLYFKRPNCGKELFIFLTRSAELGIDSNGALTGVENIIPIRWEIKEAYVKNTEADSIIPKFLRLLSDRPSDPGGDAARSAAIKFYSERGMRNSVAMEPHYSILLERIALRIRELRDLPEAARATFATSENAFSYDWNAHFIPTGKPPTPATPLAASPPIAPKPLSSVVVFYLTRRPYESDPTEVSFANQLIEETHPTTDPGFAALLTDMHGAGVLEGVHVFHAASKPAVPENTEGLLARLKALSEAKVLTLLIVDSDVWPGNNDSTANGIEAMARSPLWSGLILIAPLGRPNVAIGQVNLPPRFAILPEQSDARVSTIRRALLNSRGRVLSGSAETLPSAERVPLLKGVGGTKNGS